MCVRSTTHWFQRRAPIYHLYHMPPSNRSGGMDNQEIAKQKWCSVPHLLCAFKIMWTMLLLSLPPFASLSFIFSNLALSISTHSFTWIFTAAASLPALSFFWMHAAATSLQKFLSYNSKYCCCCCCYHSQVGIRPTRRLPPTSGRAPPHWASRPPTAISMMVWI